ncbi:hypothetical protein [Pseudomonas sp. 5P_3.1_Bac2]|uniref:hypothetical protein n=1 Tax=Pseudomonas sp. 5P_3.1_Bac2 TaxID=2971617 RepID=UPI0021C99086|nr:hypothetical protein [Pseudomonas sp. 5P_3.1_Bac2]MCU1717329.1 hypothetical protein [Pseudomonas sp. 5P_3.1_Bac2]
MKQQGINLMSEPGPLTAAGGIALYKLGAFGFFAVIAIVLVSIVVMAMTIPKTVREFVVALISTLAFSTGGGAFIVRWLEIGHWAQDDVGMVGLAGVVFVCGLPGWVLVRALFAWSEGKKNREITEIIDMAINAKNKAGL